MQIRRCEFCRHALGARDPDGNRYAVCTLIPPTPLVTVVEGKAMLQWHRPSMALKGWCGQFKLAVLKLFLDDGPRA